MLSNRVLLEVVRLAASLGGGPLGQQALEEPPRDPDHATVLADLDPELHCLLLGIPMNVLGERKADLLGLRPSPALLSRPL
jgi:hypothetical protein